MQPPTPQSLWNPGYSEIHIESQLIENASVPWFSDNQVFIAGDKFMG